MLFLSPGAGAVDPFPTLDNNCFDFKIGGVSLPNPVRMIDEAVLLGLNVRQTERFRQCIRGSGFRACPGGLSADVEDGVSVALSPNHLVAGCQTVQNNVQGEADVGDELLHSRDEVIKLNAQDSLHPNQHRSGIWRRVLAGVIWHEAAHTHGYDHNAPGSSCRDTLNGPVRPSMNRIADLDAEAQLPQSATWHILPESTSPDPPATRPGLHVRLLNVETGDCLRYLRPQIPGVSPVGLDGCYGDDEEKWTIGPTTLTAGDLDSGVFQLHPGNDHTLCLTSDPEAPGGLSLTSDCAARGAGVSFEYLTGGGQGFTSVPPAATAASTYPTAATLPARRCSSIPATAGPTMPDAVLHRRQPEPPGVRERGVGPAVQPALEVLPDAVRIGAQHLPGQEHSVGAQLCGVRL